MNKKDLIYSTVTGIIAGFIVWRITNFLGRADFYSVPLVYLIVVVPLLWLGGVWLGHFLGRRFVFFKQFGKFAAIGFTNATVDFGVLNLLIANFGKNSGASYAVYKGISAAVAIAHSYFWNKYWVFEASKSNGGHKELSKFILVNLVALIVNVSVATLIVNFVGIPSNIDSNTWANVAAVAGSAAALIFNFIGFKIVVFKNYHPDVI